MKIKELVFILYGAFAFSAQAQDLAGFQKLRGEVLSSEPEDAYSTHAYNAFDTNKETCFKAKDLDGWVGLDLKERIAIKKIRIYPRPDRTERMLGCIFQGSNNSQFANPVNLYTVTQIPPAGGYTTYDITSSQTFRYVRCLSPGQNCNLAELEFYAETGAQTIDYPQLTNLPTIYLETRGNFDFADKKNVAVSKVLISDRSGLNSYDAEVRGRGNSTWDFMDKKSFRIKFDKKQHFLGLPANAKKWVLIACAVDKTFLRNGLAFEMSRFLGFEFSPSCVYVDVVLDGFYYGTFYAGDHLDVDKNRINIDEMTASDTQLPAISGGYHLEIDAYADLEPVYFMTNRGVPFSVMSPDNDVITPSQKTWIKNHIDRLENALYANPEEACEKYIDIESAVKYYLHSELTGNCDSYWCLHTFKKRGDDRLYFGPVWDYDQAFLTNERVPRFSPTLDTGHGVVQQWFRIIMQTKAAQKTLNRLWKKVVNENLQQQLLTYIDQNASLLQQSQSLNYRRWQSLNRRVWFEDALFDTYDEYISFVKDFIIDRFEWYDEYCPGERIYFLLPSTPENTPHVWKYSDSYPENPDWFLPAYDDSGWKSGPAPFGTEQNLQNTLWTGDEIYIRTRFNVPETDLASVNKMYLTVFHDEDCLIYINGSLALQRNGYITSYQSFEIDKNLLRPGENSIAVRCIQTIGGQLIDAGIYGTVKDTDTKNPFIEKKYNYSIAGNMLNIDNPMPGVPIQIFSVEGRLIKQIRSTGRTELISLPRPGIYIVKIQENRLKCISK